MANSGNVGKVIDALERAFAVERGTTRHRARADGASRLDYAFFCGQAGGIAAAAALFGVKGLELCDDVSDAVEDGDAGFLRDILADLRDRPEADAATRSELTHITSLPVLVATLAEAVMSHDAGDRERFALMSGFTVGLMHHQPEPGPSLTVEEIVDGVYGNRLGMANLGELASAHVDDLLSGAFLDRVKAAVGAGGSRTVTTRDAIAKAYEAECPELTDWLRGRLTAGARLTDPMSHMTGDTYERYFEEQVQTIRWAQNFGLRKTRAREQTAAIPGHMRINHALRHMAAQGDGEDHPRPIEMCYWVVPGRLLAGEYPRNPDTPSSVEKLRRLTDAGVTAFIDLTEDHERLKPYAYLLEGPSHERFGIRDEHVPATDELTKQALDAIDRHLEAGRTVYVHCWGGVGRTGTIIGCWLSRHYGSGQAALDRLRELWRENPKRHTRPRSPENDEQERYVLGWGEKEVPIAARYQGCLNGLAVGDALGTTVEFRTPGTFDPVSDMVGGGPFGLRAGQWTDDTSMALCLARSLLSREGFEAHHQMELYLRWWHEGYLSSTGSCFDIGNTVRDALERFQQSDFALAGSTDPQSAGNGSLMRLAPAAMYFASDPDLAIRLCGESSRTTHGTRACIDACRYFGGLIVGALRGAPKDELLSERYCPVPGLWERAPLCDEIDEVASGSFKRLQPPDIVGSGYVVKSLEAALWAFHRSETFEEGCLKAVNLGDDADTTAAIYGQIAGAYYGIEAIPSGWLEKLADRQLITNFAADLHSHARERWV